jgi:hypothetical protein
MKKLMKHTVSACAAVALLSGASFAANPLLGGKSDTLVVADKDLANVKGTGYNANLYSYYGTYYASQAQYYAGLGNYYNYLGYDGSTSTSYATNNYYEAYYYSYYATQYYYYAYYYAYNKS